MITRLTLILSLSEMSPQALLIGVIPGLLHDTDPTQTQVFGWHQIDLQSTYGEHC